MSATPEIHDPRTLSLPSYDSEAERIEAINECDHPSSDVKLAEGLPGIDVVHFCTACGDLL